MSVKDRTALEAAIGYEPVPVSITDHPEITLVHRTLNDREQLVQRILDAGFRRVSEAEADAVLIPREVADKLHVDLVGMDDDGAIELVKWPYAERFVAIVCEQVCK